MIFKLIKTVLNDPYLILDFIREVRRNGIIDTIKKVVVRAKIESGIFKPNPYQYNVEVVDVNKKMEYFSIKPLFTLIYIYNGDEKWLDRIISSAVAQHYPFWELIIFSNTNFNTSGIERSADRIRQIHFENGDLFCDVLDLIKGDFLIVIDGDGEFTVDSLMYLTEDINKYRDGDVFYSDEDLIDENGLFHKPMFKPDYSYDLFTSCNYIHNLAVFKKSSLERIFSDVKIDNSLMYSMLTMLVENNAKIFHIARVLFHSRNYDNDIYRHMQIIEKHLVRTGIDAAVAISKYGNSLDIKYKLYSDKDMVSIIIPTKDGVDFLSQCIESIEAVSTYDNYEIIILNNNSVKEETFAWFKNIINRYKNIRVIDSPYPFNWAKINNQGIKEAKGEVIICLNNDTKIVTSDWIERLAGRAVQSGVGTVSCLLLFDDNTIQHAGVVVGLTGWAAHIFREENLEQNEYPYISPLITRNVLASTGACLAFSRRLTDKIGLFNENFIICDSDVEFSIRAYENGFRNVYDANVVLYHYESKTRSRYIPESDFDNGKIVYSKYLKNGDPFFNNNLSLRSFAPAVKSSWE